MIGTGPALQDLEGLTGSEDTRAREDGRFHDCAASPPWGYPIYSFGVNYRQLRTCKVGAPLRVERAGEDAVDAAARTEQRPSWRARAARWQSCIVGRRIATRLVSSEEEAAELSTNIGTGLPAVLWVPQNAWSSLHAGDGLRCRSAER